MMKNKKFLIILFFTITIIIFIILFFSSNNSKDFAQKLLHNADIKINGTREWDIIVHNENFYKRVLQNGSLGLGEAYMDGWWDCPRLDMFFSKIINADLENKITLNWTLILNYINAKLSNLQSKKRAFDVAQQHYDLSNDLFKNMLDTKMVYSCGYWKDADNLEDAQENKLDLICKKLYLKPGMKILDIGCGWGGFAKFAAKNYGVEVIGITVSKEQADYAKQYCLNLPITIILQDYRDLILNKNFKNKFDRVVSVGMFEHVGYKNYKEFMQIAHFCLKNNGLFLLHTIGSNISNISGDPWINKYIFTNGMLPSICQISSSFEGLFVMEDWHNFGAYYDNTLMAWYNNFVKNWENLKDNYNQRFFRMWKYYLLSCAGFFRARKIQLWQIVLSKNGIKNGYNSVRN